MHGTKAYYSCVRARGDLGRNSNYEQKAVLFSVKKILLLFIFLGGPINLRDVLVRKHVAVASTCTQSGSVN